nr:MAG TPA: POLYCOMB PROTEIN PCL, AROMATIC CAGE [Caudoviricetes sp.]
MKTEEVKIGEKVVRARGNNVGLVGEITNFKEPRVQVKWEDSSRTWVNISQLELEKVPHEIDMTNVGKFDRHGKLIKPKYRKL